MDSVESELMQQPTILREGNSVGDILLDGTLLKGVRS